MIVETVYTGRDNTIDLLLKDENGAVDLSSVTRIDIVLLETGDAISDSDPVNFPIKWSGTGVTGKVLLQLGDQGIVTGMYTARLVVFDPANPDGIVWDEFGLQVK